jgi:low temperature requirement protein LtrA
VTVHPARTRFLRDRTDGRAAHVTNMELFFDLVWVFAFTQLSQFLYEHRTLGAAAETAVILVALWSAWSYTAWATGWIDPECPPVVLLLSILMIGSLVMASAVVEAFGARGETFAIAYVFTQLLRSAFIVWVFGLRAPMGRSYLQLLIWSAISGVIWIAGGLVDDPHTRLLVWLVAAGIDLTAPLVGFRLPLAGAGQMSEWSIAGAHLAERYQLLLMIAFGESFLRIGESFANHHGSVAIDTAFVTGFVLVFALWTVYFLHHARRATEAFENAGDQAARLARSPYSYGHVIMIGAVIVIADVIHTVIEGPHKPVDPGFAALCVCGPVLYLVGIAMSTRWVGHGRLRWVLGGTLAIAAAGTVTAFGARLAELIAVTAVAVVISLCAQRLQ